MKIFKSLGLFVSACLTCGIATAADHHVKWHDDGKVDLVMEDGTTISTTREELGSLFGPDQKPFDGVSISVTVNSGGPKGGISGPLYSSVQFGRSLPVVS